MANDARGWVAAGCRHLKMKIAFDPATDVRIVAAVRDPIGPDIALGVE